MHEIRVFFFALLGLRLKLNMSLPFSAQIKTKTSIINLLLSTTPPSTTQRQNRQFISESPYQFKLEYHHARRRYATIIYKEIKTRVAARLSGTFPALQVFLLSHGCSQGYRQIASRFCWMAGRRKGFRIEDRSRGIWGFCFLCTEWSRMAQWARCRHIQREPPVCVIKIYKEDSANISVAA